LRPRRPRDLCGVGEGLDDAVDHLQ
jgi:hypothetical protein